MAKRILIGLAVLALAVAGCGPDQPTAGGSKGTSQGLGGAPTTVTSASEPAANWGTLFYLPRSATTTLRSWSPSSGQTRTLLDFGDDDAIHTATVAPDGTKVAWVVQGAKENVLVVANVDGSGRRELQDAADGICFEPTWWPDGTRVTARRVVNPGITTGQVAVANGVFHAFAEELRACHLVWSGDGKTIAFSDGQGRIMLAGADGASARAIAGIGGTVGGRRSFYPMSLSSDGRLLALHIRTGSGPDGDAVRSLLANEVIDTATGRALKLPITGELQQAYFLPSGDLVVRVKAEKGIDVILLSADLKVVAQAAEPPSLATSLLLGASA